MAENWRLIDTGLASPVRNIALNRALLEARAAEEIPSTLRFARFTRCVLLAAPHSAAQELDLDYCADRGIALQRRLTSGAACYLDERQLVWELYLHRREVGNASLHALGRRICHAAATALSALGVDARLRGAREIEVDGRTVASGGFAVEREALLFQGTLLVEAEPAAAYAVQRTPWSNDRAALEAQARSRVTSLALASGRVPGFGLLKKNIAEAFESEFDVELRDADLSLSENARCEAALPAIDALDWIDHAAASAGGVPMLAATHRTPAGELGVALSFERATRTIRRVWVTSGCEFSPARARADFEAALCDVPLERLEQRVEAFFGSRAVAAGGYSAADLVAVLKRAVRQPSLADNS